MTVSELKAVISADTSGLDKGLRHASSAVKETAGQIGGAGRVMSGFLKSAFSGILGIVRGIVGAFASLAGAVVRTAGAIVGALAGAFRHVLGTLAVAAGVHVAGLTAAMAALGRQGLAVNSTLRQTAIGLTVMLRSAVASRGLLNSIKAEAKSSAFEFTDLAGYSKKLLAFGFSARSIIPTIRTLGDTVAGLGGDKDMLDRLILAVGQMRAKGKVSADEMMQLTEAGVPAWDMLAKSIHKTTAETMQLSEKGLIPASKGVNAIISGMQQRFGGMQQLLTHELPGVMSNLHDVVSDISSTLTEGMYNSFTRAGLALTSFLDNLKRTAAGQQVLGALRATFDAIGKSAERLVANLPRATEWLAKFLNSHAFQNFAGIARDALGNVWRWISEGLGWLSENWPKVWDEAKNATVGSIKVVGGAVAGLINVWREMFANHEGTDWLKAISQGFKEFAIIAVRSIGRVADQMFVFMRNFAYLGVAIGATMALFQPTRTQGLAMLGASLSSLLRSTVGQTLSRQAENTAVRGIRGLSTESITRAFAGAENRPGIGGAFIRGYNSFGSGFDQWQANLGSKFEPFKFTPFKQSEAQGDYTVPGQDETTEGGVKENPLEVLDARIGAMRAWLENTGIWKNVMTMRYLVPLLRQRVELLKGSRAETTKGMYDLVREMFATETDLQQTWEGAGGKQSAIQPMMPSIPGPLQGIFSRIAQVRQMMAANPNGANSIRSNYLIPTMRAYVPALQNALANTYNPWQREWLTQQIQNTTLEMNGMQITNGQVAPSRNAAQFTFYISGQTPEQTFKYAHQVLDNALRKMLPGPAY